MPHRSSGISAAPASTTNSTLSGSAADSTDAPSAPAASEQAGNAEMHEGNGDEETFLARPGQAPGATPIQSDLTVCIGLGYFSHITTDEIRSKPAHIMLNLTLDQTRTNRLSQSYMHHRGLEIL